jgi:hypothetical protein
MAKDSHSNEITLLISVNGEEAVPVTGNIHAPLGTVVPKALSETKNVGRPPEDWELKDVNGTVLDLSRKIGDFDFGAAVVLFLSLKAGVAGAA